MICLTCTTVFPFLCKIKIHCSSIVLQSNLLEPTYIQEGYAKYYNKAMIEENDALRSQIKNLILEKDAIQDNVQLLKDQISDTESTLKSKDASRKQVN